MSSLRATVVGGSLSGLCAALALAADGAEVVLFERDRELGAGVAGLGVERSLLERVTGASPFGATDVPALPVITSNRDSTAWMLIHQWLRSLIDRRPRITLHHGAEVMQIRADASGPTVVTSVGPFAADLLTVKQFAAAALTAAALGSSCGEKACGLFSELFKKLEVRAVPGIRVEDQAGIR
jgi:NAD(P)-binding Rossmann-like domain